MASKVSSFASAMSSAMGKASSSMSQAESRARSLASAINALKSKTITITTVYVTRRVFAAAGGAFVTSSPTNVGPLNVSEFGQKELVTVTPLEGPGRQPAKGLSNLIQGEAEKKTKRMMDREREEPSQKGKERTLHAVQPQVMVLS